MQIKVVLETAETDRDTALEIIGSKVQLPQAGEETQLSRELSRQQVVVHAEYFQKSQHTNLGRQCASETIQRQLKIICGADVIDRRSEQAREKER